MLVLASGLTDAQATHRTGVIDGPYASLLAASTDLGPSHRPDAQLTVALRQSARPAALFDWAHHRGLTVRWRTGDRWAVVEGQPRQVAKALAVAVHDYRGRRGQVFYASPQQPSVPSVLRGEVAELGRILGYTPYRLARPPIPPRDVPDLGLTPSALLTTYNAGRLARDGYTGTGSTVVIFAFDGYDQADLDSFATMFALPPLTPTLVGGQPGEPHGETTMDLQLIHAVAPDARKVVVNARPTVEGDGNYEKIGKLMESVDQQFPGAVWSFSIGWGCDRLLTAADLEPVRAALRTAHTHGTTAFDASGDLAGLECRGGQDWSSRPGPDDVGLDSIASLPEMTSVGGTTVSTGADGEWLSEQAWFDVPLSQGTGGGVSSLFERPDWQRTVSSDYDSDHRLTPDIAAAADPFTGVKLVFRQQVMVGGGTSQAAPIWAGLTAVMNQYLNAHGGRPLGDANPLLYRIAAGAPLPGFRDVALGGNAVALATPGYDLATGLGSPNIDNLVHDLLILQRSMP
ncbi:S53 family peptidase [Mycobacterium sp. 21AC1]|nr:S53 family peptidase [Mycobacterium sp. 21AC1]MDV3127384.1 S53 family peptidase [Mycobacterium sp. 21AC1]